MLAFIVGAAIVIGALTIITYATWLLFFRLKRGESKPKSFLEWLRNVFEAVIGL